MSYLSFKSSLPAEPAAGSLRSTFARWLLVNHGGTYRATKHQHHRRANARRFKRELEQTTERPLVGVIGGGVAGLFSGLILQSLGIECEIFESSDRVGGRIRTWYSSDYDPDSVDRAGLYGELGGMRVPQFSEDMLPVQQLALAVNAVLERNGLGDQKVVWRKFYYDSPQQRLRYNNMPTFITARDSRLDDLHFGQAHGGDVPEVWVRKKQDAAGNWYLPINQVLAQVNAPFLAAINRSFAEGFELLMQFDQYSMWDYLTTEFTLGGMGPYYDPEMGAKSDLLPWSVANYLETTSVGTGMYALSFVELVIAVYDWGGSKDPYRPDDPGVYMITVDKGMQRLPDACRTVLDLEDAVSPADGHTAQVQVGMLPYKPGGPYSYAPPNLTPDAQPPAPSTSTSSPGEPPPRLPAARDRHRRVFLRHKAVKLAHDPALYDGHGGVRVTVKDLDAGDATSMVERVYPYVITTLPMGAYLNGEDRLNLLDDLSFEKAQGIRECNYTSSFKAFLTFKTQFWTQAGERQEGGYGAAATDRPNRQIIYPSYGYDAKPGVLEVYCWDTDARRLGALGDRERIDECLKGIQYLYPDVDVHAHFAGHDDGKTTKTWFWDHHSGGGAFALFRPGQFKFLYPTLLTPEWGGCLNFAGECASVHHGWIVGALDSAYNAVLNILQQAGASDKIQQMQATWGAYTSPDVADDARTANELSYGFLYNEVDRNAAAVPPGASRSIYGESTYVFDGKVPAFVADYDKVPLSMKATLQDKEVVAMLNAQWDDNVALRSKRPPVPVRMDSAVHMLEDIYHGNNFLAIPAPAFWLKDDDEFARQQLSGFMPNLLARVMPDHVRPLLETAGIRDGKRLGRLEGVSYVADYRQYLSACTVTPRGYYLAKPIVLYTVTARGELMPVGIQLETGGELFTPDMPNAANAWLLAKMQTNCAGRTLHDVGFHQLLTHQICAMVSIALFSEEVFNPHTAPVSRWPFQQHPVFRLLRPHVVKAVELQQTIYNTGYHPNLGTFPETRTANGVPGAYNIGSVYDLIFSCGRIGSYQLQDRIYNARDFRFLDLAIHVDAERRGVAKTPFSYPYVHDASLWYNAIRRFVSAFVATVYPEADSAITSDIQLQRFFDKLIPAFNHVDGQRQAARFPAEVKTGRRLIDVLTMLIWQFSVQHTVVNDGTYNQSAFVPNASTLMYAPPAGRPSSTWTPADVLACLPSQTITYPAIGNLTFMDAQINASLTGQGPYPETMIGRGVLEPSIDVLQDSYGFTDGALRTAVDDFYQAIRHIDRAIALRQARDAARYLELHPDSTAIPATVMFDVIRPVNVMNSIQT